MCISHGFTEERTNWNTLLFCVEVTFHLNIRVHTPPPEPSCFSLCRAAAHRLHAVWWGEGVRVGRKSATCWSDHHTATTKIFPLKKWKSHLHEGTGTEVALLFEMRNYFIGFPPCHTSSCVLVLAHWFISYLNEVMFFYRAASGPVVLPFSLVVDVSVIFVQLSLLITKNITFFFPYPPLSPFSL